MDFRDYLTTGQAAKRLGVTPGRVRQLVSERRFPTKRFGPLNLIPSSAVDKFQPMTRGPKRKTRKPKG